MAYTSIIPVHRLDRAVAYVQDKAKTTRGQNSAASLEEAVDYAMNRDKTESSIFETALGCRVDSVFKDMRELKVRWHKLGGVQGYHLVQSFAAGETTPEQAHQIGLELAERLLGGRFQAVVTTHLNTTHLHNHVVWNSVAIDTGKKYHSNAKSYYLGVRKVSDELCLAHGLSVIQTPNSQSGQPYIEWQAEQAGQPTWRTAIRQDVDEAVQQAVTWRQFIAALEKKGYTFQFNRKYPTLQPPGKERPVRFKTLGARYTPDALRQRISQPYPNRRLPAGEKAPTVWRGKLHGNAQRRRKLTGLLALYYRYLYELGAMPRKSRRPSYAVRQDIRVLDERIKQMNFLSKNGIYTREKLEAHRQPLADEIEKLTAQRRQLYRTAPGSPLIARLTARLKALRREEKLCRQIAARSVEMEQRLAAARRERVELEQKDRIISQESREKRQERQERQR